MNNNSGDPSNTTQRFPYVGSFNSITAGVLEQRRICGLRFAPGVHDHVLRNHIVGSKMQRRRFGTAIHDRDANQNVLDTRLRILDEYVEIAILVEHSGIEQFELAVVLAPVPVLVHQTRRRETRACGYLYRNFMYECVGVLSR